MKLKIQSLFIVLACVTGVHQTCAQGTAFTYQGRLNSGASPANGSYDLIFSLYDTNLPLGNLIAGPVTNSATVVSNGLFTTAVDFGNAFIGGTNWLAIAVSTNGANSFTTLSPRQQVTPAPYAITAANLASVVENNTLPGGVFATISGGQGNFILAGADHTTIAGGGGNSATGGGDTVSGGINNATSNYNATISGGANNVSSGSASTVSGGSENQVTGDESVIGGGQHNLNRGDHAVIGGGYLNFIGTNVFESFIGSGLENTNLTSYSVIGGGMLNTLNSFSTLSVIGGGYENQIQSYATASTIGGGQNNTIQTNADHSTIGGGWFNGIGVNDYEGVIAGGYVNSIGDFSGYSFIGGGQYNSIGTNSPNSTIAGGRENQIQTNAADSTIGGGYNNQIQASAFLSSIGGGGYNQIFPSAYYSTIAGGNHNTVGTNSIESAIGGGYLNTILTNSPFSVVPGGFANVAGGAYSFAAGQQAQATNNGAFVWADSQNAPFASTRNDQFSIRAAGGVVMSISGSVGLNPAAVTINSTSVNGIGLLVNESSSDAATLFANNGIGDIVKGLHNGNAVFEVKSDGTVISKGVTLTSDRNAKEHFAALNSQIILAKVISLPVTEWNYRDDSADKKHIGPMAQDFHATFDLNGADDKHISVVDEGGVALAAIQGLNQKVEEKDAEIQTLKQQNESLVGRMNKLELMLDQLTAQK